jgi:hypothetical protein
MLNISLGEICAGETSSVLPSNVVDAAFDAAAMPVPFMSNPPGPPTPMLNVIIPPVSFA